MRRFSAPLVFFAALLFSAACEDDQNPGPMATPSAYATPTTDGYIDVKATEQARATPTPTAVAPSASCPAGVDAMRACDAALSLLRDLRSAGVEQLLSASRPVTVTCGSSHASLEFFCAEIPAGQPREGYVYANKRFVLVPGVDFAMRLAGIVRASEIVGIGCPQTGDVLDCGTTFAVALDPRPFDPPDEPRYSELLLTWEPAGEVKILAVYSGLYVERSSWAGGPGRFPLTPLAEDALIVWWQPWRPKDR